MSTRRAGWIYLFCFSLVSGSVPLAGADRQMTLDVVVTDKSGKPVSGLEQKDFTLLDNKQPQKILSFEAVAGAAATADSPVEVVLLVDEVNADFKNVAIERNEIVKFLGRNEGALAEPVSLVFFSDSGATGTLSSRDGKAVIADLNQKQLGLRTIGKPAGFYGGNERIQMSLSMLQKFADFQAQTPGRKLLVWISPGWPFLASGLDQELASNRQKQGLFNTIVALSDGLRRARIALYNIDPVGAADAGSLETTDYKQFLKGVKTARQADRGDLALQVLAAQSGGLVLNSSNDLAGEIATCVADANSYYVLSFEGLPGDGPNEYHALEIKLDKPGLTARTRSGYYAQP
jgi:VWFA-related protein